MLFQYQTLPGRRDARRTMPPKEGHATLPPSSSLSPREVPVIQIIGWLRRRGSGGGSVTPELHSQLACPEQPPSSRFLVPPAACHTTPGGSRHHASRLAMPSTYASLFSVFTFFLHAATKASSFSVSARCHAVEFRLRKRYLRCRH